MERGAVMTIATTHVGSLPRPKALIELLLARHHGESVDSERFETEARAAIDAIVERQAKIGLTVVNDGEAGKSSYSAYIGARLSGFGGETTWKRLTDISYFPSFAKRYAERMTSVSAFPIPACTGPIAYIDPAAPKLDIDRLTTALAAAGRGPESAFMTAASPGLIAMSHANRYYPSHEAYVMALAEAMRTEYRAIVDAGFILQLDAPDLGMGRHGHWQDADLGEFRNVVALHVEAINLATADLPPERMRMHLCWGNYDGPHHHDVPLREIVDPVLRARPAGLSFEAANPRHAHEWRIWEDVALPDGKYLIPGVIDTTTNYIEHPDLIAERLQRFIDIAGAEREIGGTDCGLSTFAGYEIVDPEIAWAKLESLVEGARRCG
jgi:5-methyltetrahydropteroyltriglutamate--homocysteine methyltransferase